MMEEEENKEEEALNIETKLTKEKRLECRQIVKEIREFGVNQRQLLYIIQLLGLELEDRDTMLAVINAVKSARERGVAEPVIEIVTNYIEK